MNDAVQFICQSDNFILSCLGKRFILSNYHDFLEDTINHAKCTALEQYKKETVTKELQDILANAAFRYLNTEITIMANDRYIKEDTYKRHNTDVDFTKLKYYRQFFNSRSKIEQLIMETRADNTDPELVKIITGYDARYIAVRIYQLRKKYKQWLPEYKIFVRRSKCVELGNSKLNSRILNLLRNGYNTTYIASKLNINNKYAAVLICNIRKEIMQ